MKTNFKAKTSSPYSIAPTVVHRNSKRKAIGKKKITLSQCLTQQDANDDPANYLNETRSSETKKDSVCFLKLEPTTDGTFISPKQTCVYLPSSAPDLDLNTTMKFIPYPEHIPLSYFDDVNPPRPPHLPHPDTPKSIPNWPIESEHGLLSASLYHAIGSQSLSWAPCRVVSHDIRTQNFLIIWNNRCHRIAKKWVSRLNLRFDSECAQKFMARREKACADRADWRKSVEFWHQVASVRGNSTRMPEEIRNRLINRLKQDVRIARMEEVKKISDIMATMKEYDWHWQYAMKLSAMIGSVAVHSPMSVKKSSLQPNMLVIQCAESWQELSDIRWSLVDSINKSISNILPTHTVSPQPMNCIFKSIQTKMYILTVHLDAEWRTWAQTKLRSAKYLKPRLVDYIIKTELQATVDRVHHHILTLMNITQITGALLNIPRLNIELEIVFNDVAGFEIKLSPSWDKTSSIIYDTLILLSEQLSEWKYFDDSHVSRKLEPPCSLLFIQAVAKAYQRCQIAIVPLSGCLWLMKATPSLPTTFSSFDLEWFEHTLNTNNQLLIQLNGIHKLIFEGVPLVTNDIIHVQSGNVIRRLRSRWHAWNKHALTQMESVYENVRNQLTAVVDTTTHSILEKNIGTDPESWKKLSNMLQCEYDIASQVLSLKTCLQNWWAIMFSFSIEISDETSDQYWQAISGPYRLALEYSIARECLDRARMDYITQVRFTKKYLSTSIAAYQTEIESILQKADISHSECLSMRLSNLQIRVGKLVDSQIFLDLITVSIDLGSHPNDPQIEPSIYLNLNYLVVDIKQACKMGDTIHFIISTLDAYKRSCLSKLPRHAITNHLTTWQEQLQQVFLKYEEPHHTMNESVCLKLLEQVYTKVAQLARFWPVLYVLTGPHLKMHHWSRINQQTGLTASSYETITLDEALAHNLKLLANDVRTWPGALSGWNSKIWNLSLSEMNYTDTNKCFSNAEYLDINSSLTECEEESHVRTLCADQNATTIQIKMNEMQIEDASVGLPL